MRNLKIVICLIFASFQAHAETTDTHRVFGEGPIVCSARGLEHDLVSLARGKTLEEAQKLALTTCAKVRSGESFFCDLAVCELDTNSENTGIQVFDRTVSKTYIKNILRGKSQVICKNHINGKTYETQSSTLLESSVLVENDCLVDGDTKDKNLCYVDIASNCKDIN